MTNYNETVQNCTTIEELCATLNEINKNDDFDPDRNPDLSSLPLFGDADHVAPLGVFSWSADKYLWADGSNWGLTNRNED